MELAEVVVHECWDAKGSLAWRKEYTDVMRKVVGNGECKPLPVRGGRIEIYAKPEEPPKPPKPEDNRYLSGSVLIRLNDMCCELGCQGGEDIVDFLRSQIPTWIRVEDELPAKGLKVLVYDPGTKRSYATANPEAYLFTYWMPQPQPPKETK